MIHPTVNSLTLLSALRDRLEALEIQNVEERALLEPFIAPPEKFEQLQWLLNSARSLLRNPSPENWTFFKDCVEEFGPLAMQGQGYDDHGGVLDEDPPDDIYELGIEVARVEMRHRELQKLYKSRLETCREEMQKLRDQHRVDEELTFERNEKHIAELCAETKRLLEQETFKHASVEANLRAELDIVEKDSDEWRNSLCAEIERMKDGHAAQMRTYVNEVETLRSEIERLNREHNVALDNGQHDLVRVSNSLYTKNIECERLLREIADLRRV